MVRERLKTPGLSKSGALKWAEARQRHLLIRGKPKPAATKEVPTLREFVDRFLADATANRQKPSTISAKETIVRVHLVPLLGDKRLNAISSEDVQQLKVALARRSPKTVNNVLAVLSTLLKVATEWKVIDELPCRIRLVKVPRGQANFHGFQDFDCLVQAAESLDRATHLIVLLGGEAGLRCGEIMALDWANVDLGLGQLSVTHSEWKGHVTAPKGGRVRHVPLTVRLKAALAPANKPKGRVVIDPNGGAFTQKVVQGAVKRAIRKAGLRSGGVHTLRHTFCSHLAMRGAATRAIQELAGHQDITTTQRYMHLSPAALDSAIGLLNGARPDFGRGEIREAAGTE